MGEFPRKADGRLVLSPQLKRETAQRIVSGEKTIAELSGEHEISPTVICGWERWFDSYVGTAVTANEEVVPASALRAARGKIPELERALCRKTIEVEILRAKQEVVPL